MPLIVLQVEQQAGRKEFQMQLSSSIVAQRRVKLLRLACVLLLLIVPTTYLANDLLRCLLAALARSLRSFSFDITRS